MTFQFDLENWSKVNKFGTIRKGIPNFLYADNCNVVDICVPCKVISIWKFEKKITWPQSTSTLTSFKNYPFSSEERI